MDRNDEPPPPIVTGRYDFYTEHAERVITGGARAARWDNYHQSYNIVIPPLIGPGCPECVHLHWRWGKGVTGDFPDKNDGNPLVPTGSNQDVEIAVVAFRPGEEHPDDFHDLIQDDIVNFDMVFWYSGMGHQASDTFFGRHGGFFQPVELADLTISGTAPASVRRGADLPLTFTVTNRGPSFATEARIQTRPSLGSGRFIPERSSPECADRGLDGIVCEFGDMAPGTSRTAMVVLGPVRGFRRRVTTTTSVAGKRRDPVPSNNRVRLGTIVTP